MLSMRLFLLKELKYRLLVDRRLYAAIVIYASACLPILAMVGEWHAAIYLVYFEQWAGAFLLVMPFAVFVYEVSYVLIRFRRRRWLALRRRWPRRRVAAFLAGQVLLWALMIFQGAFTLMKNALPRLAGGFAHDRVQADIDRVLHFGVDPGPWLITVLDQTWILKLAEFNYNVLWFAVCFGGLFFVATSSAADEIRHRYIGLFLFVWIVIGNLLAGLFLSAGPVYYARVTGDAMRFADQVAFLAQSHGPTSASFYQAYLWHLHETSSAGLGSGISAFPSVHVALITMNALFLHERARGIGNLAMLYVAIILVSSVYLGWHYAIDGYVSVIVVVVAHHLARKLAGVERNQLVPSDVQAAQPV